MDTKRAQRVADSLLHEAAQILQKDVKDPRIGFVTLTAARVSPDLRAAKIYYTVLGAEEHRKASAQGLASARSFIRRELGQRLRLRVVPDVRFVYDDALAQTLHVQELLEDLAHGSKESDR
ncbi:MAG: 30S ribosome-binding factor RbfA [Deferrisomatales bacterium]|nr:30S ribosome-binding factor RbfA [Deferrisomatales bacterium]